MKHDSFAIRNVVLLGHSGSGKTSFSETMLFEAGEISRIGDINSQSTTSDYTQIERDRGNSVFSSLMHVIWRGNKINIIDTPGYDDFVGEVVSALKVADTAAIVLNGVNGVEVGTELVWEYINEYQTPTMFIINQLDKEKANFENTLAHARQRFGQKIMPVQFPVNAGEGFNTIIDALRMVMYVFPNEGGKPTKMPIPDSEINRAQEMHNILVEVAAENDEGLMDKFFDEGTLNEEELAKGLRIALANNQFCPVFCCSSSRNMGSGRIMGFINDIAPSPADRPPVELKNGKTLPCSSKGDKALFIYKTLSEPNVGMLSYFKVYSGSITSGDDLYNNRTRSSERIGQLFISNGKTRNQVETLYAGDIGVTVKLKESLTNDTLSAKSHPLEIVPMRFPESKIRAAVRPPSKSDMEKLMKALHQIELEDPTLKVEQSAQLKQTILHGQGQLHLDLIKYRIEKVNNVKLEFERPRIPYRETITRMAESSYRHKKQSGGAGQFGEVHMRIEPYYEGMPDPAGLNVRSIDIEKLPWGGVMAFYWCVVGGTIDAKYINAIKKGILSKMEEGPLTGSYVQDVRVCVYDGKMHSVDSNDMAFMLASMNAFKQAFKESSPQILEPIYDLEILCDPDHMGDIMGDLQTRRAMIMGMDTEGHYQKILARVPLVELYQYSNSLRSITAGRAKFSRKFAEYAAVPPDIQQKLASEFVDESSVAA